MAGTTAPANALCAEELARAAADWLLLDVDSDADDPTLYHGCAGVAIALQEAYVHFGDERYRTAAERTSIGLAVAVDEVDDCSLYFGLAGIAVALHAIGGQEAAVERALMRIRAGFDGERWGPMFELMGGNAGIGLAALQLGDLDLALLAVTPYLHTADQTSHGVNWPVRPSPPRSHHIAHGTLGIVASLARVGRATDTADLIDLALEGAADVVARSEDPPVGFLVPHSDPPHRPDIIERYSYGWCNGPAGDAQVFRILQQITGDDRWVKLQDACWHTIQASGLPRRLRPGFWDNHGRCCGTAGVLALACDRLVERGDLPTFAELLVQDLSIRSIRDNSGARWSNHEHRTEPNDLPPRPGWAMGNAGILRELLRYTRLVSSHNPDYAVAWPDQPPTQ